MFGLKNIFKKEKFPTTLFIIASLSAFVLILMIIFFAKISLHQQKISQASATNNQTKLFLKNDFVNDDDYITKRAELKDLINGPIITADDPSLGNDNSDIIIVQFSDFTCQYCQEQEKILKQAMAKFKIRLVWKDYPETDKKSNSYQSAIAARCAQKQGKFWEYHDRLFGEKNSPASEEKFLQIAKGLNLDENAFSDCIKKQQTSGVISDNMKEANALNITGIPFIYVNNQEIMGQTTFDELSAIIKKIAK